MARYRVFKQFNQDEEWLARWRRRVDLEAARRLGRKGRIGHLIRALSRPGTVRIKELVESLEFYSCVRKRLRGKRVVDLCCGHGLTGSLFGIFDDRVQQVTLLDRELPKVAGIVHEGVMEAFPELEGRITHVQKKVQRAADLVDEDTVLTAVHACGSRTDHCLDLAVKKRVPIAVLPCCYTGTGRNSPATLRENLGVPLAADVERTYRLEAEGFKVVWDSLPESLTPMNRVLIAHPVDP